MSDLWEDDGTACTPCRGCTPCPVASKPAGPSPSTPDASEAVRSPHSTSQTLPSPSVLVRLHMADTPSEEIAS